MTKELSTAFDDLFSLGEPEEKLGNIPAPMTPLEAAIQAAAENFDYDAVEAIMDRSGDPEHAETPPPSSPEIPLHTQFIAVRTRLLELESIKLKGGAIDLKEVQSLCNSAADLMSQIQTSTTGPKKKVIDGEVKEKKTKGPAKAKKASTITHLNIPDGDDF